MELRSLNSPGFRWRSAAVAIVVLMLAGIAVWWTAFRKPAVRELKLRQLTTNSMENAVYSHAISPDGQYLAYADHLGVHIRNIESGETRTVSQPADLKGKECCEVDAWFPDSTRFVIFSGDPGPDYSVQTSSNLTDWVTVFTTNSPATPFSWTDPAAAQLPAQFYRVLLGP